MIKHNHENGLKAESYFCSFLNDNHISYEYSDDWFDFKVNGLKVEVKSCRITIRGFAHHKKIWRIGQFDFTNKENRDKMHDENIWICFMVRHNDEFIILGFIRAKALPNMRYLSLHKIRDYKLLNKSAWLFEIMKMKKSQQE